MMARRTQYRSSKRAVILDAAQRDDLTANKVRERFGGQARDLLLVAEEGEAGSVASWAAAWHRSRQRRPCVLRALATDPRIRNQIRARTTRSFGMRSGGRSSS
jgi:hypothetical protein